MRKQSNFRAEENKFPCARKYFFFRTEIYLCAHRNSLRADANEREHINPPTNEPARRALFGEDKPSGLELMLSQKG